MDTENTIGQRGALTAAQQARVAALNAAIAYLGTLSVARDVRVIATVANAFVEYIEDGQITVSEPQV